ncbi:hypothetical protein F4777DRAFT_598523 [Nemania sp. FL0916]|nr:hypothetical protein F4777DRAFT_598523 [Nemania sp. FL0916]
MALALRLTALSCAVALVKARWLQPGASAGDWAPATPTAQHATLPSDEWPPQTTSAPGRRRPLDGELRRRVDTSVCGYSVGNLDGPAVTCDGGGLCRLDQDLGIVGCCTEPNPRGCIVPTTCLDFTKSSRWSGDPLTTYCSNSDSPYCVTHSYDANFYDPLYGAYFLGCAARAASGDIVASPTTGADANSTTPLSTFTSTNGVITTTITVNSPSSPTSVPSGSVGSSGSRNVGAIVGGVIGGVAGLVLIIAAIAFLLYRRKKRSRTPESLGLGRKMPPSDLDMYHNEPVPGSQYPSTFYGEAPPGMVQAPDHAALGYPPSGYGFQNTLFTAGNNHSTEAPAYHAPRAVPSKQRDEVVSPIEESPVSPVSPAENYNTMVSALSNQSPPLQPLQPAVHRPQPEYAQYSPPPPEQYQSYRPYPGT